MTQKQSNKKRKIQMITMCNNKFNVQSGRKLFEFGKFSARILERFYQCNSSMELMPIYRQTLDVYNLR